MWVWADLPSGSIQLVFGNMPISKQVLLSYTATLLHGKPGKARHSYDFSWRNMLPFYPSLDVYGPSRIFSALRKCIPRRSQGDQKLPRWKDFHCYRGLWLLYPYFFGDQRIQTYGSFWGIFLTMTPVVKSCHGNPKIFAFFWRLGRWFSFSMLEHKAPMFLIHTGPTYSTVLVWDYKKVHEWGKFLVSYSVWSDHPSSLTSASIFMVFHW